VKPILEIQNVSKQYSINKEVESYLSIRDSLTNVFKFKKKKKSFLALEDISFKVEPGESIGVIGKNGAGKSTLLKILSRITPPTTGQIITRGRIASLLEVGTGFHPELTGHENILLNGSILGLSKKEILSQYDEIVDFSGVESFLTTPLKHYSSGMQLRLAFAVAAHLQPEILIIDEVLAVGDHAFQQKCIGKMGEVSRGGRTIIFVSHNMAAIRKLCSRSIMLENGRLTAQGDNETIISKYLEGDSGLGSRQSWRPKGLGNQELRFLEASLEDNDRNERESFLSGEEINIKLVMTLQPIKFEMRINVSVLDQEEDVLFLTSSQGRGFDFSEGKEHTIRIRIPGKFMKGGVYRVAVQGGMPGNKVLVQRQSVLTFEIVSEQESTLYSFQQVGRVSPQINWSTS
jgi:lipopolysaccharide transport system ATP-binding protein